jgi:N-acetylglutamate synthase-like GNAT family acetyltransferase
VPTATQNVSGHFGFDFFHPNPTFPLMNSAQFLVRRATLDDLSQLVALWEAMQFPTEGLSKRITEFQVAVAPEGHLLGAIGLELAERQGRVHSEAFSDFALAEQLRPLLWDRLQSVALNHGLLRLWTQEQAPFWSHSGLLPADKEILLKLPAKWRDLPSSWLTLKLKDDPDTVIAAEEEFAAFMQAEKQRSQKTIQQAKVFKVFALLFALTVVGLALGAVFYLMHKNPHLLGR